MSYERLFSDLVLQPTREPAKRNFGRGMMRLILAAEQAAKIKVQTGHCEPKIIGLMSNSSKTEAQRILDVFTESFVQYYQKRIGSMPRRAGC